MYVRTEERFGMMYNLRYKGGCTVTKVPSRSHKSRVIGRGLRDWGFRQSEEQEYRNIIVNGCDTTLIDNEREGSSYLRNSRT